MERKKSDKHVIKVNQISHMDELADSKPDKKEVARFRQKPYQATRMIREQGKQMERKTAAEYLQEKCRGDKL